MRSLMKFIPVFFLICLFGVNTLTAQQADNRTPPPNDASLKEHRFNLNTILSVQLPTTLPDSLNGKTFGKTFSFRYTKVDSSWTVEVHELRKTVERDSTFGGSRYYLPLGDIDLKNIKAVTAPDSKYVAVTIPAKPGTTFLHQPFGYEPERRVAAVTIGWYEKLQEKTLLRALEALQKLLGELGGF